MNRDLLEQYTDAVKLIKETKETIKKLEKRNSVQTKDTVSGSNSEFPFQPILTESVNRIFHTSGMKTRRRTL